MHRRELENSEREDLIERAASGRLGTYIDVDYARRLLGTAGWQSALTDPDVRDHLEYIGRVMPTISILTALAFREQATTDHRAGVLER